MSADSLRRLLTPRSVAVIGGGTWCRSVLRECRKMGFDGPLWPVHPRHDRLEGEAAYASVEALPHAPDAVFIGVNRHATLEVLRALKARGAGGAVCFASGFGEAEAELADAADLQAALPEAAQGLSVLGPNCYGFVNALDGVSLWPDQHGLTRVERGVAILSQSSNVALNLSMQCRGLPIGFLGTLGNQALCDLGQLGRALLEDPRITALGVYVEGIADLAGFEALARQACRLGKRIVVLKTGASEQARAGAVSHTASLAGSDAGARALFRRLGVAQVTSPESLIEALKILHVCGPLASGVGSMSCSGGEAALMADLGQAHGVDFPPLGPIQSKALRRALGPKVALANPLDYHTYVWGDQPRMTEVFSAMMDRGRLGLGLVVLDFPRQDRCDPAEWPLVVDAVAEVAQRHPMAILTSMAEGLPEDICADMLARGVLPLCGMQPALEAIAACTALSAPPETEILHPGAERRAHLMSEVDAKHSLASAGVPVPRGHAAADVGAVCDVARTLVYPLVLKRAGEAHKTESGGVVLGLKDAAELQAAAETMGGPFLVEEMVPGAVAELLVGVTRDPAHGFVLTLAAGGVMTELLSDRASVLLPVSADDVRGALRGLRMAPVLDGWRGRPSADIDALVAAVLAVQAWVMDHAGVVEEVEINPLLCLPKGAVAVDALIRRSET